MRKANPEKSCFLQYDKLYIDTKIYVYNEVLGQVVEHTESVRWEYTLVILRAATDCFCSGRDGICSWRLKIW